MNAISLSLQKANLDQWVQEVVRFHFSSETGSRFWLRKQDELNMDVIKEVTTYSDLKKLGLFDEDELAECDVLELLPQPYQKELGKIRIFETGGTKGDPKRIFDYSYRKTGAEWLNRILNYQQFPQQGNWLHIGPVGPHSIGHTVSLLASMRNGLSYFIDFDPRWVKKIINTSKETFDQYIDHICEQALNILETQSIDFLFTTPKLLELIWDRLDLEKRGIKGVLSGGTRVSRDMNRIFRKEVMGEIPLVFIYGNTLMGSAPQASYGEQDLWDLVFYPNFPYFMLDVVDFEDPYKLVDYENRGRVRMTSLNMDFFIPNLLERDEGVRIAGSDFFPWDGVAEVRPYEKQLHQIIEGIY